MDSRGLPGGQSGRPGWTVGQSGMDSRPVSRADSDHFGKLESFHSRHHLTQTWSDLRCRSINMLFSHPPAAPGASQGAPVAWIRENRPLTGGRFLMCFGCWWLWLPDVTPFGLERPDEEKTEVSQRARHLMKHVHSARGERTDAPPHLAETCARAARGAHRRAARDLFRLAPRAPRCGPSYSFA